MFQIAQTETYLAPVTVELPGVKTKQVFDAEFVRLTQDEIANLFEKARELTIDDKDFCRRVVVGWNGVNDQHGAVEFSAAALDALLRIYPVAASIVQAYNASLAGARAKN